MAREGGELHMTEEAARDAEDQEVLDATQRGHFGARRRQPQLCALPSVREYAQRA